MITAPRGWRIALAVLVAIWAAAMVLVLSRPARSQTMRMQAMACAPRADVLAGLRGRFSEDPVAIGLSNAGGVVEVLASADGATWTLIVTDPQGVTCLMAAGEFWEAATPHADPGQPM